MGSISRPHGYKGGWRGDTIHPKNTICLLEYHQGHTGKAKETPGFFRYTAYDPEGTQEHV